MSALDQATYTPVIIIQEDCSGEGNCVRNMEDTGGRWLGFGHIASGNLRF